MQSHSSQFVTLSSCAHEQNRLPPLLLLPSYLPSLIWLQTFDKTKLLRVKKEKVKNAEVIPSVSCVLGEASHASCWLCYGADLTARWFTCPVSDTTQSWGKFQQQPSFDSPMQTTSSPRLPVLYHPPTGAAVKASLSPRSVLSSLWSC